MSAASRCSVLQVYRLASDGGGPSPPTSCGSHAQFINSPLTAGPQPRDVLRLARSVHKLASDGGAPAPRRLAARTATARLASDAGAPEPPGLAEALVTDVEYARSRADHYQGRIHMQSPSASY